MIDWVFSRFVVLPPAVNAEPSFSTPPTCHGWLELLGCGRVDPFVLETAGYDPSEVSGFAFGMGPERLAMVRYGIDSMKHFIDNDVRFLRQFI